MSDNLVVHFVPMQLPTVLSMELNFEPSMAELKDWQKPNASCGCRAEWRQSSGFVTSGCILEKISSEKEW